MESSVRNELALSVAKLVIERDFLDSQAVLINRGPGGREVALAITKIQEAEHWLRDAMQQ